MKGKYENSELQKKGVPLGGTVGKGGLIEPCSECLGCLGGSLRRNRSGSSGRPAKLLGMVQKKRDLNLEIQASYIAHRMATFIRFL